MESLVEKVLAFDIDGVVADFEQPYVKFLSKKTGTCITTDDVTCWHFYKLFGITEERHTELFMEFSESGGYRDMPPLSPAIRWLKQLIKYYKVYFITHRPESVRDDTKAWFRKHLPEVSTEDIFMVRDKGKLATSLGVTHFVDDKMENVLEVFFAGVKNSTLFSALHNESYHLTGIRRANTWEQLMLQWGLLWDFTTPVM